MYMNVFLCLLIIYDLAENGPRWTNENNWQMNAR